MKVKQTENEVKKAIIQYLELKGYKVYRITGDAGVADLYAINTSENDYPIWVEVKATGKKPSSTQCEFGEKVNKTFGTAWIWADSLDMFTKAYEFRSYQPIDKN